MKKIIYGVVLMVYGILPLFSILQKFDFFSNSIYAIEKFIPLLISGFVPYFMSRKKDGYNIICGIVSYIVLTTILNSTVLNEAFFYTHLRADVSCAYTKNIFMGVLCGLIAYYVSSHFEKLKVPMFLSFFQGKRLMPIVCMLIMFVLSLPVYVIWKYLFHIILYLMDFFNVNGLNAYATVFDIGLSVAGLQNIFNKFYIFPDINAIKSILLIAYTLIYVVLIYANRKNKNTCILLVYFCVGTILLKNLYITSLLFLYVSFPLWMTLLAFLIVLSICYPYKILCFIFMILYVLFLSTRNIKIDFKFGHSVKADLLIQYLGGFENIKEVNFISDSELGIVLYNTDFILSTFWEYVDSQREGNCIILYLDNQARNIYDSITEELNKSLNDLIL